MECYFLSSPNNIVDCFSECPYYNSAKENPADDCPFAETFKNKSYARKPAVQNEQIVSEKEEINSAI